MLAGLPYVVWPIGSLFILASRKREDPFLLYHAVQGLCAGAALGLVSLLAFIALVGFFRILPGSASYLPGFLGMGLFAGGVAIALGAFLTAVFLAWRATEGEMLRLPVLGDFAEEKMLDQTGMTRSQFIKMLEESFIEPGEEEEEIPFPEAGDSRKTNILRPSRPEPQRESPPQASPPAQGYKRGGVVERGLQQEATGQAKSYSLISGKAPGQRQTNQLRPSPPQRSPEPPRQSQAPTGWQSSDWQNPPPAQPSGSSGQSTPRVKDVDLIRHYKERKSKGTSSSQGGQQSDVLRQWLSSVDD